MYAPSVAATETQKTQQAQVVYLSAFFFRKERDSKQLQGCSHLQLSVVYQRCDVQACSNVNWSPTSSL